MSLNDTSPEHELASRYLDGDLTPDERAHVEASPDLLALVASLRHVATLIAAVPAISDSVREAAITSALAKVGVVGGRVVSLADRRRWPAKVLSAAAAVLLLSVVGAAGVNYFGNSADNKSESATRQTEPMAESQSAEDAIGSAPADDSDGSVLIAMGAPLSIDNPQQLLLLMPSTTPSTEAEAHKSFNIDALACLSADQVFLADVYFQGMLAIAVRDTVTGVTEAIDSTCAVLASVAP